jgi:ubiquinone/menaquinone biosynthesis C-methylase UbiE
VGCGTGQFTRALTAVASHVVGVDISWEMVAEAQPHDSTSYIIAPAERLPFESAAFDLVTSGLAFHWFDRTRFLPEAWRTLKQGGVLAVYNNVFTAVMRENSSFEQWMHNSYGTRYPPPPRHNQPLAADEANAYGFTFVGEESFTSDVSLSPEELAAYITTHSNVIAAVEQGSERIEDVYEWLLESTRPFFNAPRCTFVFSNLIWLLMKRTSRIRS